MPELQLSRADARRLTLAAQGFAAARPSRPGIGHVRRVARRLGALQIDSVNVLVRAHYMPLFSRLGAYPMSSLDQLAHGRRELFEYIGHAACFVPVEDHPLFRWRMDIHAEALRDLDPKVRGYVESIYDALAEKGPLTASDLPNAGKSRGPWWGWSDGKRAVEALWRSGRVAVAGRRRFERVYDVTERVIRKEVLALPTPSPEPAKKELIVKAARALGVGTAKDLSVYYYLDSWWDRATVNGKRTPSRLRGVIAELVDEGRLVPAKVEGWKHTAYVVPGPRVPVSVDGLALVSPFDPLLWERKRAKALFDFDYTIEIYVPAAKRKYGYYVLPFLLGDSLVARVDLKADRRRSVLLVPGVFKEAGTNAKHVTAALGAELRRMADWLGLERIEVGERGDLARELARAVRSA